MSVPIPPGIIRAATETAVPPLEPPGIINGSQGLRAGPVTALLFVIPKASSCMFALAPRSAPASKRASATGAFRGATRPARAPVAPLVVRVFVAMLSLRASGTPASGPAAAVRPDPPSTARAASRSASQSCETKALSPAIASERAMSASTYSRHEHARSRSAAAASPTVSSMRSVTRTLPSSSPRCIGGPTSFRDTAPRRILGAGAGSSISSFLRIFRARGHGFTAIAPTSRCWITRRKSDLPRAGIPLTDRVGRKRNPTSDLAHAGPAACTMASGSRR